MTTNGNVITNVPELPVELVEEILQQLHDEHAMPRQSSLNSAAQLNRAWYHAAIPQLYRRPHISSASSLKQFLRTLNNTPYGLKVEALYLSDFALSIEKPRRIWGLIGPRTPGRDKALDKLITVHCPNLIELYLDVDSYADAYVDDPRQWVLSSIPPHPRDYIARLQTLTLGPSLHWLSQAFIQNTIDCTNLTSLTLRDFPTTRWAHWRPLPCLTSLRIIGGLPWSTIASLLNHVAPTLNQLSIESHKFTCSVYWPTLPHLRGLHLIDVTSLVGYMISALLASLPGLQHLHLSNVELGSSYGASPYEVLRLRSLIISEQLQPVRCYFRLAAGSVAIANLLERVTQTLVHLEIHDTFLPVTMSRVGGTYFIPILICVLPKLVALRSLHITCRQYTPVDWILRLPGNLKTVHLCSLTTETRLEDMFKTVLSGEKQALPHALREIHLVAGSYDWIETWLRPRLMETGVVLLFSHSQAEDDLSE